MAKQGLAARGVEILHELLQTVFRMEGLAEVTSLLVLHPLVGDRKLDTPGSIPSSSAILPD